MEVIGDPIKIDEKVTIIEDNYKIKSKGTFNLEELYVEMKNWFEHMDYKWYELEYKQVINRDGSKNLEILWLGEKKIDDYVKFVAELNKE